VPAFQRQIRAPLFRGLRTTAPPTGTRRKHALIEHERNQLFDEITMLREAHGPSSRAIDTAQVLLTRQWIRANWRTREQLIKATRWLVRLEGLRGLQSPS
jgi:hypothetical protein